MRDLSADPTLRLAARGLGRTYDTGSGPFEALRDASLEVRSGEFIAVTGRSGSGKSTLINLLSGLDRASRGSIWSTADGGTDVTALDEEGLARWRGRSVGIVFQFFQLLPALSVLENTMMPMDLCNMHPRSERRDRAMALLADLGIEAHADKLPLDMSGGQQQRAAIARALANDPAILFADEPTGNLDTASGAVVMEMFAGLCARGKSVVMVTHDQDLAPHFTRTITLEDGRILETEAAQ